MTELSLNQLKLREDQQPDYPLLRQPAACQQWGSQQSLLMSQSGCATVLLLWQRDLMELSDAQRVMCEKVYGALLAVKGPLRAQQGLRSQVIDMLDRSPQMYLHGARLYVAMVSGLPFIPVAPRMRDLATGCGSTR